ncbi:GNAT family N-acetyltransferase [Ancylomarina salipaludis]|uniref:GNAT family N-acetyltransferase n=1 Tax=Ancylomarina salipaludis TaxID=2501299 RepID=A0A4Q1JMM2_9BACT|nr:GNAT family N-acetyltransferase [Ancylomarina salipaludis]RXQ95829.1 GNAT family N-acetyltransferase [Ancylomarina salipaludis]
MNIGVRKSDIEDIGFLLKLEEESFPSFQRSTKQSLKHGIQSDFQEILIAETDDMNRNQVGALVLFKYSKSLRIYSIAILPEFQKRGYGDYLLKHALEFANRQHYEKILIEVSAKNTALIDWYKTKGFKPLGIIDDYYCEGEAALKMELKTRGMPCLKRTSNVIVINQPYKWTFKDINAKVISVKEYINNPIYQTNTDFRIFNLCSSYKYQTYGYYVSLLASARGQRIIPSTITIRDFGILNVIHSAAYDIEEQINSSLYKEKGNAFTLNIYFGQTKIKGYNFLASKLHQLFEAPLFKVDFIKHDEKWMIKKLKVLTLNKVPEPDLNSVYEFAEKYFNKKRFNNTKLINYKYDIAVLVDPKEANSPSCPKALEKFKSAANRKGLYLEFITKKDIDKINEFDALFIRETTCVNNHTYEFSRMAYAEGLVVLDDPWSILRCSNKIYQNEIFKKHKILTPETNILTKNLFDKKVLKQMNYPLVLKQPDSAFSLGVIKVDDEDKALKAITDLFKISDMLVCQEYMYSEFDWRIGIIDNTPLFACKYYMSKDHWQIYNWKGDGEENSGDSETLSIELVPDIVIQTALKASALIGDGLYGVDLKMIDGKVYVVEVNDNPNIDADIEDLVLKDKLYDQIIESIYNRIEISKNVQRIDFRNKQK